MENDSFRGDTVVSQRTFLSGTLLPGWHKINLKEAKVQNKKGNDFYMIHSVMTSKQKKGKDEPVEELVQIKEHFQCRNSCSKDIWIEKLAIASQYELPKDTEFGQFMFDVNPVEQSSIPEHINAAGKSNYYNFGSDFPEK